MTFDLIWHDPPDPRVPIVVLIHGLGVSGRFWRDPAREPLAGGLLTVADLLPLPRVVPVRGGDQAGAGLRWLRPAEVERGPSPWTVLAAAGLALAAYSQEDSHAPMSEAVAELEAVLRAADRRRPQGSVVLVGHSRGGLIARWLLETRPEAARRVRALITLGTPHAGSRVAALAWRSGLAVGALGAVLAWARGPRRSRPPGVRFLRQAGGVARSPAVRELVPGSHVLRSLAAQGPPGVAAYSIAGTCPTTFRCYRVRRRRAGEGTEARAWLTLPDALARGPGRWLVPEEWRPGQGDGSVCASRARLPWARGHRMMACNHMGMVLDPAVHAQTLAWIREACGPWRPAAGLEREPMQRLA